MEFEGFSSLPFHKLMSCVMLFHLFTEQRSECIENGMKNKVGNGVIWLFRVSNRLPSDQNGKKENTIFERKLKMFENFCFLTS